MREMIKKDLFAQKLRTNIEMVRRKLDFEVIKDNYENKMTQKILEQFTDLSAGMPGSNYKYVKIRELLQERQEEHDKKMESIRAKQ